MTFRATQLPWHENPFWLISWLEMKKFSAEAFYRIGIALGTLGQALHEVRSQAGLIHSHTITFERVVTRLIVVKKECRKISLIQSAKLVTRTMAHFEEAEDISLAVVERQINAIEALICSELEEHLFLWVPPHRSEWHSKDAEAIVGAECCSRFPSIRREVEEAAKCYALGRYTASGFHITRATEAGVQALARAIAFKPPHNHWNLVFQKMEAEFATPPAQRPKHWKTHGKFLTKIWGDLMLAAKVWRNDLAHLGAIYDEEQAKELLEVLPKLLRDLATQMDENGKLYS